MTTAKFYSPDVQAFTTTMLEKLAENEYKSDYMDESMETLMCSLLREVAELAIALNDGGDVEEECADVANYAMMIAAKERGAPDD